MKKLYKKLTQDQKKQKVVFSSCLSQSKTEQLNDTIHEINTQDANKDHTIKLLTDDSFFNGSHFKYNIIRR